MYEYLTAILLTCGISYYLLSKRSTFITVFNTLTPYISAKFTSDRSIEYLNESIRIHYGCHTVTVPYQRNIIPQMSTFRVYADYPTGRIEITHQNGIPYLVTGNSMGANRIIIVDMDGKEHIIPNDKLPSIDFVSNTSLSPVSYSDEDSPSFE
jgi:hypothetical protein